MNKQLNIVAEATTKVISSKRRRRFSLLVLLALAAVVEFYFFGLARRTFVFYTVDNGTIVVEDRMLKRSESRERDITLYAEETLLGPVSPELLPLFPRGTKLKSLLYRDGVVYADFSEDAVLPPIEGGVVENSFQTLYTGILRNFSFVKDVRFFIEGEAVYEDRFRKTGNSAFNGTESG